MAPVLLRKSISTVPIPRPSEDVRARPLPGTRYISLKVLIELFAGTFCIFVLGVLFWKAGGVFRRFTKDKVVKDGNASTRYARTWYGWVPMQRHNANKELFRKCFGWVRDWASWRSSKVDYSWVWWDPGQKMEKDHQNQGPVRWLPGCIRSYGFTTADTIWDPCRNISSLDRSTEAFAATVAGALPSNPPESHARRHTRNTLSIISEPSSSFQQRRCANLKKAQVTLDHNTARKRARLADAYLPYENRRFLSLDGPSHCPMRNPRTSSSSTCSPILKYSLSLPCLLNSQPFLRTLHEDSDSSWNTGVAINQGLAFSPYQVLQRSRKYQVWSAKMQLETLRCVGHRLLGPPGSPRTELLASFSSHQTLLHELIHKGDSKQAYRHSFEGSDVSPSSTLKSHPVGRKETLSHQGNEVNARRRRSRAFSSSPLSSYEANIPFPPRGSREMVRRSLRDSERSSSVAKTRQRSLKAITEVGEGKPKSPVKASVHIIPQIIMLLKDLSDWEIRFIDNLDRRLDWVSYQLSPGRRPFHFAMLANHWLNKKTWIVYDPVCRVSVDARLKLGDPRFNVPYTMPDWAPRPKYPEVQRTAAHKPRIDSWRKAMNRQRRLSGLKDIIKTVDLYDSSADEPPDGMVDPASWILRKPPQGFSLSTRQHNTYYEGGSGWQEKLSDWQKIRRGYRIHKMVYEGKVNRTRAKEIMLGIVRH